MQRKENQKEKQFKFWLKGKTLACIDWANVYRWKDALGWAVDPRKLYSYLGSYPELKSNLRFYFGTDKHPKSKKFLQDMEATGYKVVTKEVKYVPVTLDKSHFKALIFGLKETITKLKGLDPKDIEGILNVLSGEVLRRKCDFDVEVTMDAMKDADKFEGLILFGGDGDYAPILKWYLEQGKQVIVVAPRGKLGKEIVELINEHIYICFASRLQPFISQK